VFLRNLNDQDREYKNKLTKNKEGLRPMFNVGKSRKTNIEKIADEVSRRVFFLILAFPCSLYGNIPNSLIESDYVVNYHFYDCT
jgi:hypothetical protein